MNEEALKEVDRPRRPPRVGWVGFHMETTLALRAVHADGYEIAGVIGLTADAAKARSGHVDVGGEARELGVPFYEVSRISDEEGLQTLAHLNADIVFVIGWSQILSPEALVVPRVGCVGAHASILPHGRGRAPVNWALIEGRSTWGNTLMWLSADVDAGRIIDQRVFRITKRDTVRTVYQKVARSNESMILDFLARYSAGSDVSGTSQPSEGDLYPGRRPEDGRIDWTVPASGVYDFVRAQSEPYPGAFTSLHGVELKVWESALLPIETVVGRPGEILGPVFAPNHAACGVLVACGVGAVVLRRVQREGGQSVSGDGVLGLLPEGMCLGS